MSDATAKQAAPLDEVMLAMDVVDTLRHRQDLVARELDAAGREQQLITRLREIYHQQGIEVPDHILKEGVAALAESRFAYTPPPAGLQTTLARLYVSRRRWGRLALIAAAVLLAVAVGWFGIWQPYRGMLAEQARVELSEGLPAQMDALYQSIYDETKVQAAVTEADELRQRGRAYAAEGNREEAERMLTELTALRDTIRQEYTLRIVNRPGVQSAFWTFPEINTDATNYYVTVEAVGADGNVLSLPIRNEESDEIETVSMWAIRVPESVYDAVSADKRDDGIIQGSEIGRKNYGFVDVLYNIDVLGGAVTQW